MKKRTLKDIENDQVELNRAFEDLDRDTDRLKTAEKAVFEHFSTSLQAFRRLEYQLVGEKEAQTWVDFISSFQRLETLLDECFQQGYRGLKQEEWQLEEKQDQLASEKKRFYMEEDDNGH